MAINLPLISKFSQSTCFPTSASTSNIQQSLLHLEVTLLTVLQLNHSSLFCSKVINHFLCIILVIRKTVKNLSTIITLYLMLFTGRNLKTILSSIKNFQICLCKCIQKDPEVQKNKLNKSQWDRISFPREKKQDTTDFFSKSCNYIQYSL